MNISKWHHVVTSGLSVFKRSPMQTVILICIKQQNFSSAIPVTVLTDAKDIFLSVQREETNFSLKSYIIYMIICVSSTSNVSYNS